MMEQNEFIIDGNAVYEVDKLCMKKKQALEPVKIKSKDYRVLMTLLILGKLIKKQKKDEQ